MHNIIRIYEEFEFKLKQNVCKSTPTGNILSWMRLRKYLVKLLFVFTYNKQWETLHPVDFHIAL